MVDETYQLVASHVDEVTQDRIIKGEYVDFGCLVPWDRVLTEDDSIYEMIVKEGKTFWVPAGLNDIASITNYNRWEQAFRVFSDIYMRVHPQRSAELVQYNHLIHTAAQTNVWENVYLYDKDFRIHLSNFPKRSWAIILQQARFNNGEAHGSNQRKSTGNTGQNKDLCKRWNRFGRCSFGNDCVFDHHCSYCFKFGHTVINGRKLKSDLRDDRHEKNSRSLNDRFDKFDRSDKQEGDRRDGGTGKHKKKKNRIAKETIRIFLIHWVI